MATSTHTITIGYFDDTSAYNFDSWGFNSGSYGSISPAQTPFINGSITYLAWTQGLNRLTVSLLSTASSAAAGSFSSVQVGGVTFQEADATFQAQATSVTWYWQNVTTNPIGTQVGSTTNAVFTYAAAFVAPVISSISSNNISASVVNTQVKLSSTGSGGTLEYASTLLNSVPSTGWQTSSNFTHRRGSTQYYWASQDRNTGGAYTSFSSFIGFLPPDTSISFSNSAIQISSGATSAAVTLQSITAGETYQVRNQAGSIAYATGSAATTSLTLSFTSGLPTAGNTLTYQIYARRPESLGGDQLYDATGDFFTVERLTEVPLTAPTSIQFEADPGTSASTVNLAVTAGGGGGTMQVSDNNSTWLTNGSDIPFRRGVTNLVYARSVSGTQISSIISSSLTLSYIAADTTVSPVSTTISSAQASASIVVNNVTSGETYQIRNTAGTVQYQSAVASGTSVTITQTSGLPAEGSSSSYTIYARRPNSLGGSEVYTATGDNFTVSRTDGTPNAFSFSDVTAASRSSEVNTYVQITGITQAVTASRTAGTATFAVSSTTTTPTSGFSSTAKTITNNQYLHVKEISSDTLGATKSSTFSVGGVSDNWQVTTTTSAVDFLVTVLYEGTLQEEIISFTVNGSSQGTSISNPITINAGQTVAFKHNSTPALSTMDVYTFDQFTNNSNITNLANNTVSTAKTWASGVAPGTVDSIGMYIGGVSDNVYFRQPYLTPDTTISFCSVITVATSASSFIQTITEVAPNNNSASTVYTIRRGTAVKGVRTGPGNITINEVPTFLGVPEEYTVESKLPLSAGGNSANYVIGTFDVIRGTAPGANPPGIDPYGVAIYDHNQTFVTSFTEESTVLREIYKGSATTSTSGVTNVNTGLYGLSAGNAIVSLTYDLGDETSGVKNIATTIVSGSTVRIARDTVVSNVDITVTQYKGTTISTAAPADYGINIYNAAGQLVIDDLSNCYAVRELIVCNPAASNVSVSYGQTSNYILITLEEGRYPFTGGLPIPAIQGPGLSTLIPPYVETFQTYTSSYKYVRAIVQGWYSPINYTVAILTEQSSSTPSYYGGTASDYGVQVKDSSGTITWDSSWRQAIVNNVIPANQFTSGSSGQFAYDVTSGADGVLPSVSIVADSLDVLVSRPETVEITGLNDMDPQNTFLLGGGMVTGAVYYREGVYFDPESDVTYTFGGGTHVPGLIITSNTSVNITMARIYDGPAGSEGTYATRVSTSHHPEGSFVLARIT